VLELFCFTAPARFLQKYPQKGMSTFGTQKYKPFLSKTNFSAVSFLTENPKNADRVKKRKIFPFFRQKEYLCANENISQQNEE
jgi:hypothetical protein